MLHIRLDDPEATTYEDCLPLLKEYLGGVGLGAYFMNRDIKPEIDPFNSDNHLYILVGPANGLIPFSGKLSIVSKSPMNFGWGEAHCGGLSALRLREQGLFGIDIAGKAEDLSILYISNKKADLIPNSSLLKLDSIETYKELIQLYPRAGILTIGEAGTKLVRFASITSDGRSFAGRSGMGSVMGSKNLKAILIEKGTPIAKKLILEDLKAKLRRFNKKSTSRYGTAYLYGLKNKLNALPTKNHKWTFFDQIYNLDALVEIEELQEPGNPCPLCHIKCKKNSNYKGGGFLFPEYETISSFGSNCLNSNLESIIEMNDLTNRLGMDTIEMGNILSLLMELNEKGLYDSGLEWGDTIKMRKLIELTGKKQGIGRILAEGVKRASIELSGTETFALTVKGLSLPAQHPRTHRSIAITHSLAPRGADHLFLLSTYDEGMNQLYAFQKKLGKEISELELLALINNLCTLSDCLVTCKSVVINDFGISLQDGIDIIKAVTGYLMESEEELSLKLFKIDELRHQFNEACGISRVGKLPERVNTNTQLIEDYLKYIKKLTNGSDI